MPDASMSPEHPVMATPFAVKPTVPVGDPPPVTLAVKVTDCPMVDGFTLEATVVTVVARLTTCVSVPLLPVLLLSPE
jgi:hypothetical protein